LVVKKKRKELDDFGDLGLDGELSFDEFGSSGHEIDKPEAMELSSPDNNIERLATQVLNTLIKEAVPPTPNNFQLYFDRLIEEQPDDVKEEILSVVDLEDSNSEEQAIAFEQKLKTAFTLIKQLLQISSNLYKNTTLMTRILTKRQGEIAALGQAPFNNILRALQGDLSKLGSILGTQTEAMKQNYQKTANIVKEVEQGSIFDQQFGVYNKRYLLTRLGQEAQLVAQFKHNSSLVTVALTKEIRDMVPSQKAVLLMEKTVARLLMKTSRRSDIVAHYSEGVFAMLLKHTDLINAERASNRLIDLVKSTNFFLGEKEVVLGVNIGIANIAPERSAEETLLATLDAMKSVSMIKDKFVKIYEKDLPAK